MARSSRVRGTAHSSCGRARSFSLALLTLAAGLATTDAASAAEPFAPRAERILSPGRSAASEDSVESIVLNPANLAYQPAWELRWTGVRCADTRRVACGHALGFATPLLFGLSTGLRVDYVMPPDGVNGPGFPYRGIDYTWLTWGLGYKLGDRLAVGASVQGSYSTNPYTDDLFGISAGLSYRPNTHLGLSFVAHDFNGPATQKLPSTFTAASFPVLDRTFVGAMAFRPFGTRAAELGAEIRYFDGTNAWRPRALLGIDVPNVGRIRADVEVADVANDDLRAIQATAGAEIYLDRVSLGGGAIFGSALGRASDVGQYATLGISGYTSPGVPAPTRAVWMRLEGTPGTRTHVRLLRRLWKIAEDKEIASVTVLVRAEPAASFAHAEELADAFRVLRARGKKVICSFEAAGPKALYACASADRIVINPAGGVRYAGLKSTHMYLAGLLDKIGVKAEFVRIGAHKGSPEQFMNEHASDTLRADQEDLLRQNEAVFAKNLELYRKISWDRFKTISAKGPYVASEAREAGLVDGFAFDDELERVTKEVLGRKVPYLKDRTPPRAAEAFGRRDKVAVLYIDGDIIDGRSRNVPLLDMKLVGSYTIADTIRQLKDDRSVKAVVVRIESPGGSSLAADVMWRELVKLNEKKPVIASMGSIAASGGYYVAAPARQIFALPLTVTGSIGIFYGKADVSGLLGKLGVNIEVRKTAPRADAESFYRGFTPEERVELQRKVGQFYDVFLDRVSRGRHMSKAEVDKVAQGRVWMGQQAYDRRLVDRMGGLRHALEAARQAAGLPDDAPIAEYPPVEKSLFETALGLVGLHASAGFAIDGIPVQAKELLRGVAPLTLYGEDAMARLEWLSPEDTVGIETDDD